MFKTFSLQCTELFLGALIQCSHSVLHVYQVKAQARGSPSHSALSQRHKIARICAGRSILLQVHELQRKVRQYIARYETSTYYILYSISRIICANNCKPNCPVCMENEGKNSMSSHSLCGIKEIGGTIVALFDIIVDDVGGKSPKSASCDRKDE